jgi:hypothetical protein
MRALRQQVRLVPNKRRLLHRNKHVAPSVKSPDDRPRNDGLERDDFARRANHFVSLFRSCPAPIEKIFLFFRNKIRCTSSPSRPARGALRGRHERWEGDAMDAAASGARIARGRMMLMRTAKTCGPDAPTLASSLRQYPQATVAKEPGHRGEPGGNR